jgi:hypothetical protein
MIFRNIKRLGLFFLVLTCTFACKKSSVEKKDNPNFTPRHIVYEVTGTNFRLNYIDSNDVFQKDQIYQNTFRYEFQKGPGAWIGISIFLQTPADSIRSWSVYIDNKLYANAFSVGGAYLTVPYN